MLTKKELKDLNQEAMADLGPKINMVFAISAGITATIFICSLVFLAPAAGLVLMSQIGAMLSLGLGVTLLLSSLADKLHLSYIGIGLLSIVAGIASLFFPPLGLAMLGLAVSFVGAYIGIYIFGYVAGLVYSHKALDEKKKRSSNDNSTRQMSELSSLDRDCQKSADNSFNDEHSVTPPKTDPCLSFVEKANPISFFSNIDLSRDDNESAETPITEYNGVPCREATAILGK